MIRCINIFRRIDTEFRSCQVFHLIKKCFLIAFQDFALFHDIQFSFYRMVLTGHVNDYISGCPVYLIQSIGIHRHLISIFISYISIRGGHFLDTVIPDLQVLGQDQIALLIGKERLVFFNSGISGHLLHIFFIIQVIDFELRIFNQDWLLRLVIFFHDPQLRLKFIIQKYPPYLRCIRLMLCDMNQEVLDRCIIIRCGGFPYNISSKGKRDAAGIAIFIGEYLRFPVRSKHHRSGGLEIISPIFLCFQ